MTEDTRGALADLAVLGVVAIGLWVVATKPAVRRIVLRGLKYGALTAAPALLRDEVTRAWSLSATGDRDAGMANPQST